MADDSNEDLPFYLLPLEPLTATLGAAARAVGYGWNEISQFLGGQPSEPVSSDVVDHGLNTAAVQNLAQKAKGGEDFHAAMGVASNGHVASSDVAPPNNGALAGAVAGAAGLPSPVARISDPDYSGLTPGTLSPAIRGQYAHALLNGEVSDASEFATKYAGSLWRAAQEHSGDTNLEGQGAVATGVAAQTAAQLPNQQELTDYSIALWRQHAQQDTSSGAPLPFGLGDPSPGQVSIIKQNLLDHWTETGELPTAAYQRAQRDGEFMAALTKPKVDPAVSTQTITSMTPGEAADAATLPVKPEWMIPFGRGFAKAWTDTGEAPPETVKGLDALARAAPGILQTPVAAVAQFAKYFAQAGAGVHAGLVEEGSSPESGPVAELLAGMGAAAMEAFPGGIHTGLPSMPTFPPGGIEAAVGYNMYTAAKATQDAVKVAAETGRELAANESGAVPIPMPSVGWVSPFAITGNWLKRQFSTPAQAAVWSENKVAQSFMQASIRDRRSMAEREGSIVADQLEQYRPMLEPHYADFDREMTQIGSQADAIRQMQAAHLANGGTLQSWQALNVQPKAVRPSLLGDVIRQIEDRSTQRLDPQSPLAPFVDAVREVNTNIRGELENRIRDGQLDPMGFVQDYWRHLWDRPDKADSYMGTGVGRTGSSASLNERTLPTFFDGIQLGLRPKITDLVDNQLHYTVGMLNYMATHDVRTLASDAGLLKYVPIGDKIPDGWQSLTGRSSIVNGAQAFAPKDLASGYNSWVGRGFADWGPAAAKVYEKLQFASNMMLGLKLMFPAYHTQAILQEMTSSGFALAAGKLGRGEIGGAMKDIGYTATVLPQLAEGLNTGRKLDNYYLQRPGFYDPAKPDMAAETLIRSGLRFGGRQDIYKIGGPVNFLKAWQRGSMGRQLGEEAAKVWPADESRWMSGALAAPRAAEFAAKQFGHVMDVLTEPLFGKMIPYLKEASAYREMQFYIRQHPQAAEGDLLLAGRRIADSMDDRYGELNQDNLFWNRTLKQALNLYTVSLGWEYGSVRAEAGGVKDLLSGNLGTRSRWLLGFPIALMMQSSIMQYLHTGSGPKSWQDFVLPQTDAGGDREIAPGYQKDFLQQLKEFSAYPPWTAVYHILAAKANPMIGLAKLMATNQDWRGKNIDNMTTWMNEVMDKVAPIPFTQKVGAGMSQLEQFLTGNRAVSRWQQTLTSKGLDTATALEQGRYRLPPGVDKQRVTQLQQQLKEDKVRAGIAQKNPTASTGQLSRLQDEAIDKLTRREALDKQLTDARQGWHTNTDGSRMQMDADQRAVSLRTALQDHSEYLREQIEEKNRSLSTAALAEKQEAAVHKWLEGETTKLAKAGLNFDGTAMTDEQKQAWTEDYTKALNAEIARYQEIAQGRGPAASGATHRGGGRSRSYRRQPRSA